MPPADSRAKNSHQDARLRSLKWQALRAFLCFLLDLIGPLCGAAEIHQDAYLVPVPLPITGSVDLLVKQNVEGILTQIPDGPSRPTIVFEFSDTTHGEGSEFERSLALARYLSSARLGRVRTVAYLPQSVHGHAILPVLACQQIIIHPDAEMGDAGHDEANIDVTMRSGYREIALRKRTIPVAIALAMLDGQLTVYRIQTASGTRYLLSEEREELQASGQILETVTLSKPGQTLRLSGRELRVEHGFASHLASDRRELAAAMGIRTQDLQSPWGSVRPQSPLMVEIQGATHAATRRTQRLVEREREARGIDWVCFHITSSGGAPVESADMARYVAGLAQYPVHTVVYVDQEARADAALSALMCDQLYLHPTAILGGASRVPLDDAEIEVALQVVQELARERQRHWSIAAAILDERHKLARYTHAQTGATEILCEAEWKELADHDQWIRAEVALDLPKPLEINGEMAQAWGLAHVVQDSQELASIYGLAGPIRPAKSTWADDFITALASPQISGILLFVAMFTLIAEFSAPGIGVGGFVSLVCFALFFWGNFLNGTAGWLEVLLFVIGTFCILLEVLVLPGFGIFGLGGVALVLLSLILASQTFVIPHNRYELQQLPRSLGSVLFLMAGLVVGVATLRRYLHRIPGLSQIVLHPPTAEGSEGIPARYDDLLGQQGLTTTPLTPSGKAQFGPRWVSVLSQGEVIESGQPITVVSVTGNCIVVRRQVPPVTNGSSSPIPHT